jgi:hypothetical protein
MYKLLKLLIWTNSSATICDAENGRWKRYKYFLTFRTTIEKSAGKTMRAQINSAYVSGRSYNQIKEHTPTNFLQKLVIIELKTDPF